MIFLYDGFTPKKLPLKDRDNLRIYGNGNGKNFLNGRKVGKGSGKGKSSTNWVVDINKPGWGEGKLSDYGSGWKWPSLTTL